MAGYLRQVAILQLALVPAILITYTYPYDDPVALGIVYVVSLTGLWVAWVVVLVSLIRKAAGRGGLRGSARRHQHPRPRSALSHPTLTNGGSVAGHDQPPRDRGAGVRHGPGCCSFVDARPAHCAGNRSAPVGGRYAILSCAGVRFMSRLGFPSYQVDALPRATRQ
jgi:hypothetical protein